MAINCRENTNNTYLCQVNETVSCGACCGLYNLSNLSRTKLEVLLSERTKEFSTVPRTEDELYKFRRKNKGSHRLSRPFPEFHHCSFLGFIDEHNKRVGCLLHPAAPGNNSVDYRVFSWYGEKACREYFCPTTYKLPTAYLSILTLVIDNWYDYGLIVTEHALLTAYFQEVESRIGRAVTESDYTENIEARSALKSFAELKSSWPYRRQGASGPCNFFFENGLYPRSDVFRAHQNIRLSRYEKFFRELESGFSTLQELEMAEHMLDNLFDQAELAIVTSSPTHRSSDAF